MQRRIVRTLIGIATLALTAGAAPPQDGSGTTALTRGRLGAAIAPGAIVELTKHSSSTAAFIENRGQFDSRVRFQAQVAGKTAWLTDDGIVFDATRPTTRDVAKDISGGNGAGAMEKPLGIHPPSGAMSSGPETQAFDRLVFAEDLVHATCCSKGKVEGLLPQPGVRNYFRSDDASKWRTNVHSFAEVIYHDVWPGIDLRVYGSGTDLEQEFIVQPGADLKLVQVAYRGVENLSIDDDGSLAVLTSFGVLRETKPKLYELIAGERRQIEGRYKLTGQKSYTFDIPSADTLYALVVDPTLLFSTYVGGSGQGNSSAGVAVDLSGNAYIAGTANTGTFPTTVGAFQSTCPSSNCVTPVVSKFDPLGHLQYSTFLGSAGGEDIARAIAVSPSGEAYITGHASPGFPTTSNAYQQACFGVFMTKLNPTGTALLYSTCLGTNNADEDLSYGFGAHGIAVDTDGRAYLTGNIVNGGSRVGSYPVTLGALQPASNGNNAFVSIVDPSLSGAQSLVYSTFLGGSGLGGDVGYAIAADTYGNAYVTGSTADPNFPVTPNSFQTTFFHTENCVAQTTHCPTGFVAKINPTVSGPAGLIFSTFLGGTDAGGSQSGDSGGDVGLAIAVDGSGSAYVAGTTFSFNFPITGGAFQTVFPGGDPGGFVTKLSATGGSLVYSTYLGGQGNTQPSGIVLDAFSNSYVTGSTTSLNFPTTTDAFQPTHHPGGAYGYDAFLTEINSSGSGLLYSTYLGGSGDDSASGLTLDDAGDVFVAGTTTFPDFPITGGAFQSTISTNTPCGSYVFCPTGFLTKFPLGSVGLTITGVQPSSGGNAGTVTPEISGTGFHNGATAKLNCGNQLSGTNVIVDGRRLSATFDLTAASPGTCDVVVTNPDSTSVTLPQAFTVSRAGGPNIQLYSNGLAVREGVSTNSVVFLTVSNTGNVDASGYLAWLSPNPLFVATSASPPDFGDLAKSSSSFDIWISDPIAAGATQVFTSTATTTTLVNTGDPALTAQYCISPVVGTDWGKWGTCVAGIVVAGSACGAAATACIGLSAAAPPAAIAGCLFAVLGCGGGAYLAAYNHAISDCFNSANIHGGVPICISFPQPIVFPTDPNSLFGPFGVGGQRWMSGAQPLTYGISFSNEPTASVPAQNVVVNQPLNANVDPTTLTLLAINLPNGASSVQVPIPAGSFNPGIGVNEFVTVADLRPAQSLLVNVDAKFNAATSALTWALSSIDPITGLPPANPLVGLLPPGMGGSVAYSVKPIQTLSTGTQINDQASVIFDANAPLGTSVWTNTIDNTPPTSAVTALPTNQTCPNFKVSWSGSDVGSGLASFAVYVSDSGSPFAPWLSNTTTTAGTFIGAAGHSYGFYSIAQDLTGNLQAGKISADAATQVASTTSCTPPSLSAQILSTVQNGASVTVSLQLTNTGQTAAQSVNINQITARTLSGSGTVTLISPIVPAAAGSLAPGASVTVPLGFTVPTTVTRFSLTESGNLLDPSNKPYNYSFGQSIIP